MHRSTPFTSTFVACLTMIVLTGSGGESLDIAKAVDHQLQLELAEAAGDTPIEWGVVVDDWTFARRVTLDLTGYPPRPSLVTAFVSDTSHNKREQLIEQLLASRRYGENWAKFWRDVIMYRRSEDRSLQAVPALEEFLAAAFNENRPWDEVATEFICATGDIRTNGATAIYAAQMGRPEESAAEFSRIFLGIQLQCAQCHDHPYDSWKREQFHEFAAFFPRITLRPVMEENKPRSFELVGVDQQPRRRRAAANNNRYRPKPEHFMSDLNDPTAPGTQMQPVFFLTGEKVRLGTSDADRRSAAAEWVTDENNHWFATAMVNRMWGELVGESFYDHVDDLGPERTCKAPRTLDLLVREFTTHHYDVKWLMRTICNTQTYQRQIRSRTDDAQTPFTHGTPQRLRADALYHQLAQALWLDDMRKPAPDNRGMRRAPERLFERQFGYDPSEPRDEVASTIPQSLMLMNSTLLESMLDADRRRGLGELLTADSSDRSVIEQLYVRSLGRLPSKSETDAATAHIQSAGSREEGCEDVLWMLINTAEFLYRP